MGPNREMKFALEKHWRGALDEAEMLAVARNVEDQAWSVQMDAGVGLIAAGDHCLYDNMLAWCVQYDCQMRVVSPAYTAVTYYCTYVSS